MKFIDAIKSNPNVKIFVELVDSYGDIELDDLPVNQIEVLAADAPTLHDYSEHEYFLIKSKVVRDNGAVEDCYVNLCLPERIADYAYFLEGGDLNRQYIHDVDGEVIFGVAIECMGQYDSYYSRRRPEVGINILQTGLSVAKDRTDISLDLGYIFRDECRYAEAIPMFLEYLEGEPAARGWVMFGELALCYKEIGDHENYTRYKNLSENNT